MPVNGHILINALLEAFDLGGTFVFALSGATAAVKHRLDLFGVLVLSFVAGNSGGIARDVMIGAIPPAAINDWRYVAVCILAGMITFFWYRIIDRLSSPVLVFDAAGLALFAVAGAGKALAFHAGPVAATLLGMLTGIGGGMVRDVLVREIPTVLRTELYAVAALVGAAERRAAARFGPAVLHIGAAIVEDELARLKRHRGLQQRGLAELPVAEPLARTQPQHASEPRPHRGPSLADPARQA